MQALRMQGCLASAEQRLQGGQRSAAGGAIVLVAEPLLQAGAMEGVAAGCEGPLAPVTNIHLLRVGSSGSRAKKRVKRCINASGQHVSIL